MYGYYVWQYIIYNSILKAEVKGHTFGSKILNYAKHQILC
jgi:hypothetical protein